MRILIGSFIVTASVLLSQGSQDFRNRYGEPDRERFAARPGITLTVEYGSDHLACYALIDTPQPLLYSEEHVPLMSSEGVAEVLEEVAPVAMRGEEINTVFVVSGCNEARTTDYEKVWIMRTTHTCDPSSLNQDVRTTITFKREICPKPKNSIYHESTLMPDWHGKPVKFLLVPHEIHNTGKRLGITIGPRHAQPTVHVRGDV